MSILQQSTVQVNFEDDTYAVIDPKVGAVSIHRGQRTGADDDWGGEIVAWLELDKALAIFEAVQGLSGAQADDEDAWIDELARRHEERLDAIHDATSAHFGHD